MKNLLKKILFLCLIGISLTINCSLVERILRVYRTTNNGSIQFRIVIATPHEDLLSEDENCQCIFAQKISCDFHDDKIECLNTDMLPSLKTT